MTERSEKFKEWQENRVPDHELLGIAKAMTDHLMEQYAVHCVTSEKAVLKDIYEAYEMWTYFQTEKFMHPTEYDAKKTLNDAVSKLRKFNQQIGLKLGELENPNKNLDPWLQLYLEEASKRFSLLQAKTPILGGKQAERDVFGFHNHDILARLMDALAMLPILTEILELGLDGSVVPKTRKSSGLSVIGGPNPAEYGALALFLDALEQNFDFEFRGYSDAGESRGNRYKAVERFFHPIAPDFVSTGDKIKGHLKKLEDLEERVTLT